MNEPSSERVDVCVSSRSGWLSLVARSAAEADPGLLDPASTRDWAAVQERGEGVVIPEGADTAHIVMGELARRDWGGLVDKASWKLDLSSGALLIGGAASPEQALLPLEPGVYWVTLYSFATDGGAGELLVHLQQAEDDEDFLRTSFRWSTEEPGDRGEPLALGSDDSSEILALDGAETEELLAAGEDIFESIDDEPSGGLLVRLGLDD